MNDIAWEEHLEIYKRFKNGGEKLTPIWHIEKKDIDFKKTNTTINLSLLEDGYTILAVDAKLLMNKMGTSYVKLYQGKLYKDSSEDKISQVIYHWMNGEKLIPPIIIIHDSLFSDMVTNAIAPQDGNHRLRVAYYFGVEKIPIIVLNQQLNNFKQIMGI